MTTFLFCLVLMADEQAPPAKLPTKEPAAATESQPSDAAKTTAPRKVDVPTEAETPTTFLDENDRNGDGVLGPTEVPRRFFKYFVESDIDRNGTLDAEELIEAQNRLGDAARRADGLKLDEDGELVERGRPGEQLLNAGIQVLLRMDLNKDGYVEAEEMKASVGNPQNLLALGLEAAQAFKGPPPVGQQSLKPGEPLPATEKEHDGYPTTKEVIDNLDRNKNSVVDRDEAVDRLAENFRLLDRDNNGSLDSSEIDQALRLAKLMGVKPKLDPNVYRANGAGPAGAKSAPPAPQPPAPTEKGTPSTNP